MGTRQVLRKRTAKTQQYKGKHPGFGRGVCLSRLGESNS